MNSKICNACGVEKPFSEFYARLEYRDPSNPPTLPGHTISHCVSCMKDHSSERLHRTVPRTVTEQLAIQYLSSWGIYAAPGKSVYAADVDVVAWGCVWIEVKYALLKKGKFTFSTTPKQQKKGFRGHIVMLICDWGNNVRTYHLFDVDHAVFYIEDRVKTGWVVTPGQMVQLKHEATRVVMLQPMMDEAKDNLQLIGGTLEQIREALKEGTLNLPHARQ